MLPIAFRDYGIEDDPGHDMGQQPLPVLGGAGIEPQFDQLHVENPAEGQLYSSFSQKVRSDRTVYNAVSNPDLIGPLAGNDIGDYPRKLSTDRIARPDSAGLMREQSGQQRER